MTTAWIIFGTAIVVGGLALIPRDNLGMTTIAGIMTAMLCGVAALITGIWMFALHYDRATCHAWAHKTGRETRFAYYNATSWECLTRAHDGRWVPKGQIGDFNK